MNQHKSPFDYYSKRVDIFSRRLSELHRLSRFTPAARLLSFIAMVIMLLWFIKSDFHTAFLWLCSFFLVLFILSVIWDLRLVKKQKMLSVRLKINQDELKYLQHKYSEFDDGHDFAQLAPELSGDFDLFGAGSLFQYLNRCVTQPGRELFAKGLFTWSKERNTIRKKQKAIEELSTAPGLIENFRAVGLLNNLEKNEILRLKEWLTSLPVTTKWLKSAGIFWPFIMAGWIGLTIAGFLNPDLLIIPILTALFIVSRKIKTTKNIHAQLGRSAKTLRKYAGLVAIIEETTFTADYLKNIQHKLISDNKKAGTSLKKLFGLLEKFDYRLNLIVGTLLNILFLFDFHMLAALEKWKKSHQSDVPAWFDAIAEFDAMTGYAIFAFNNREYTVFPKPANDRFSLSAKDLKHPLLSPSECVGNDISFSDQPKVLVITGANMAGKSTFLRTLTVNLIMGMNGAPVCAREMLFSPCGIRSSINIRDSLSHHESYFYAELQRLKGIVEHVKEQPNTFVVLDEILRGTNSRDKHNGTIGLLEKLIKLDAIVVIATHDLGVGELEKKYPEIARNYCFEVELDGNHLIFDYKLKTGISQKLNASLLMKKMGLCVDDKK